MRIFIRKITVLLLAAAIAAAFAGCRGRLQMPGASAEPSAAPSQNASPMESEAPTESGAPTEAAVSEAPSDMPSGDPSAMPGEDAIEGFMEGVVVDPDSVPELTEIISRSGDYDGMAIQSVTYKLYEGRQAYYVVLQGEGDASRQLYVFADGTTFDEE